MIAESPTVAGSAEHSKSSNANEVDIVLDYLLSHKKEFTWELLKKRQLTYSGTVQKLRERLNAYISEDKLGLSDLIETLNQIEGWGNQHIYLYRAPDGLINQWVQESFAKQRLRDAGIIDLLNQTRPLVLPEHATLSEIQWSSEQLRFVWVESRKWEERVPERDLQDGNLVWHAYKTNVSRGIIVFEWDLLTGNAMLMINRLPTGSDYRVTCNRFSAELEPILNISQFEPIQVSRAIQQIEESSEVRRRQLGYESRGGGKARFTSADYSQDIYQDIILHNAAVSFHGQAAGLEGNFYWLSTDGLSRELYCCIYGDDQRIGIFGQHIEKDVRHVLSRIFRYCG